jgi:hypothetical protein
MLIVNIFNDFNEQYRNTILKYLVWQSSTIVQHLQSNNL